jgi:hypothetical protein
MPVTNRSNAGEYHDIGLCKYFHYNVLQTSFTVASFVGVYRGPRSYEFHAGVNQTNLLAAKEKGNVMILALELMSKSSATVLRATSSTTTTRYIGPKQVATLQERNLAHRRPITTTGQQKYVLHLLIGCSEATTCFLPRLGE